jgi:hypothetical protein
MKFPYIFHRYIHLFPNGERATMDVWIHPTEVIHPSTLKENQPTRSFRASLTLGRNSLFKTSTKRKAVRLAVEQLESLRSANRNANE